MKRLTNKRGIITVMAALLVLAALLTGCSNGITGENERNTLPAGMGAVRLNFNNDIARTILPDTATLSTFNGFMLQFTTSGGTGVPKTLYRNSSNLTNSVSLVEGTYTLIVIAYLEVNGTYTDENTDPTLGKPAAAATISGINITDQTSTPVTVVLRAFIDNPTGVTTAADGTFHWVITNDVTGGGLDVADMTVSPISGGASVITKDFTSDSLDDEEDIAAGYYYVVFELTKGSQTITFNHILHVYQNMTSTFTYSFKDELFTTLPTPSPVGTATFTTTPPVYQAPEDLSPVLSDDGGTTDFAEGNTISTTAGTSVTITVTNASIFTGGIVYYYDGATESVTGGTFDLETATGDTFETPGLYEITVKGTVGATNGVPYTTYFYLEVN